jgi:hypothetical protein
MSAFHLFQRVRIVGYHDSGKAVVGREGVIHSPLRPHAFLPQYFGHTVFVDGDPAHWFFEPAHLVPATYLPDAEDLATLDRAPDFDLRRAVRTRVLAKAERAA